jgi:outer membrane immunogenic protein
LDDFWGFAMKKLSTAIAALALIGTPAFAADMAVKGPPAAPPAPVLSWTGWYVGINFSGTWGDNRSVSTVSSAAQGFIDGVGPGSYAANSAAGATGTVSPGNAGFIGGGQIGFN